MWGAIASDLWTLVPKGLHAFIQGSTHLAGDLSCGDKAEAVCRTYLWPQ